jgi:hypothetical protein
MKSIGDDLMPLALDTDMVVVSKAIVGTGGSPS